MAGRSIQTFFRFDLSCFIQTLVIEFTKIDNIIIFSSVYFSSVPSRKRQLNNVALTTEAATNSTGVPQGRCLGPLLFRSFVRLASLIADLSAPGCVPSQGRVIILIYIIIWASTVPIYQVTIWV